MSKVDIIPNDVTVAMGEDSGSWVNENAGHLDVPVKVEEQTENLAEVKDYAGVKLYDGENESMFFEMASEYNEIIDWDDINSSLVSSELQSVTATNVPQEESVVSLPQPPLLQKHYIDNRQGQGHVGFFCGCRQRPFTSWANLRAHLRYHRQTLNPKFTCQHCERRFATSSDWKKHLLLVHKYSAESFPKGSFACAKCGGVFLNRKLYSAHLEDYSNANRNSACYIAASSILVKSDNTSSSSEREQIKHSADNTKFETGWFCTCKMQFSSHTELRNHLRYFGSSLPRNYKCESCECRYQRFENLKRHMVTAHNIKVPPGSTVCGSCYAFFTDRKSLQVHRVNLHGDINAATRRRNSLVTQHGVYKGDEQSNRRCICGKTFSSKHTLRKHIIHSTSQVTFTCNYCLRKFWHPCSLRSHVKNFHKCEYSKTFACYVCGDIWSTFRELKKHQTLEHPT